MTEFHWLKVAPLLVPRASARCTLLEDGRVRVEGGSYFDLQTHRTRTARTELYSPSEDRWSPEDDPAAQPAPSAPLAKQPSLGAAKTLTRDRPTLTRLASGAVLVTGGFETTYRFDGEEDRHSFREVELADARTGEVRDAGKLPTATHDHGVVVFPSGAVLIIGGNEGDTSGSTAVQLGVPAGMDLALLGATLSKLAGESLGEQRREGLISEARALTKVADYEGALALAREACRASPANADAWRAVGHVFSAAERYVEAVEPLRRATELDAEDPFARSELADALFLSGRVEDARCQYERVVTLCQDDPTWTWRVLERARQQLQFISLRAGEVDQVALGPGADASSLEWNNAGAVASALGRSEDARRAFERATQVDPKNDYAWGNLASALLTLGRPKDALAAADKTLALCSDPRRMAQAHVSRGIALYDLGQYSASVEAYDASLELHALPYAWNNRANSLRKLGREEEAFESFERACALDYHAGHWGLACILVKRGELDAARSAVERAAQLDPSLVPQMRQDEELAPLWSEPPAGKKGRKRKGKKSL